MIYNNNYELIVALIFVLVIHLFVSICLGQSDGQYTPSPSQFPSYQWGHYSHYDSRGRPIIIGPPNQPIHPYDTRRGYTPDPKRRLIEDPGDLRCKEAIHQNLDEFVTVNTAYGNVVGRFVYLCDGPQVPERDRPLRQFDRPLGSPSVYRPIRHFWKNVTAFLGIPYARPPTRENNLRFKVRIIKFSFLSKLTLNNV